MSVYSFLTWKKSTNVILYAYPKGFNYIYAIYPPKNTKYFELVISNNSESNHNEVTTFYNSITKAILAAQKHFNNMVNSS